MRALLINPYTQTVSEIDTNGKIDGDSGFYALLAAADPMHTNMVELIRMGEGVDLWIDEEGCLTDGRPVFQFEDGPAFAGAALLLSSNEEGDSAPLPDFLTVDLVKSKLVWTDLVTTGDFGPGSSEPIDHPVFGKTQMIKTGDPIYRDAAGYFVYRRNGDVVSLASAVHFRTRSDALIFAQTVALADHSKIEVREAGH